MNINPLFKIFNSRLSPEDGDFFNAIHTILGFSPHNLHYYKRAFTHRSLQKHDNFGNPVNFERLEFLGDAILGSIVTAYLFEELPEADEGYLTKMRSKIVSRNNLNRIGREFQLMRLMKADENQNQFGENIYGNLFESLVGAVFKDRGYTYCKRFIYAKLIIPYIDIGQFEEKILSHKSHLIEWCQKKKYSIRFIDCEDTGQEGVKHFSTKLFISEKLVAKARETSKKKAEEKAAKRAYYKLQNRIEG